MAVPKKKTSPMKRGFRRSADALAAYPPGIPNVLPGEIITAEIVDFVRAIAGSPGGYVRGAADTAVDHFRVVSGR